MGQSELLWQGRRPSESRVVWYVGEEESLQVLVLWDNPSGRGLWSAAGPQLTRL